MTPAAYPGSVEYSTPRPPDEAGVGIQQGEGAMHGRWADSTKIGPAAMALLALGLVLAVATDGRLPAPGTYALFGALAALDGLAIAWLTRPRGA